MSVSEQDGLAKVAREWLAARDVIAAFLAQLNPDWPVGTHKHNAAAILARLASHDPPIMTGYAEDKGE